jgi:acetylglutamate kinase
VQKNFSLVLPNASSNKKEKAKNSLDLTATNLIKNIIRRSSEIKDQVIIIKLPSVIIENDELLTNFAENVNLISICGAKVFIVHDHTSLVGATLKLFGVDEKFVNNIKVADHKSSQIIEMVLSGYINKLIVSKFCKAGCHAIGISGKDGNLIQAKKSKLSYKRAIDEDIIDIGFISEPVMINPEILLSLEDSDIIPIISPVASDENDRTHLLDVNLTASLIASSLDADHLILPCEELILGDKNLKVRDVKILQKFLHAKNHDPKSIRLIEAAICAIANSTDCVHFVKAISPDSVLLSMFSDPATT